MINGYSKIARVDLTLGEISYRELDQDTARKYIGGVGLAARTVWHETGADTDPLSPQSPLIFMTGPVTGTPLPLSSRHFVAGLSPLTGIWGQATSGGNWADELRHAGFDGIIIVGVSEKPVYLWAHNGAIEIRDAGRFWGRDTYEVSELLQQETDAKASVACIGRAGERLVRLAGVVNDGSLGRIAARCGLGALMGSKKLKAIVARGTQPINIYDQGKLKEAVRKIHTAKPVKKLDDALEHHLEMYTRMFEIGAIPIKNWREGTFEAGYKLFHELRKVKPYACRHCGYGCGESYLGHNGERHMVAEGWGPLGANCLVDDPIAVQQGYALCNRYGMDSISVGGVIGFAMECFEKGLITTSDTDGIELSWGNGKAMVEMVKKIGEAEGLGEVLGRGVRLAAERIGGLAPEYAQHVKGLEMPIHDPRAAMTMALGMSTGSIGATHVEATGSASMENYFEGFTLGTPDIGCPTRLTRFTTAGKAELVTKGQNVGNMLDSLVVCNFIVLYSRADRSQLVESINSVTGWDMDIAEFMKTGERIFNLKRMINVRRGISRKDDTLQPRFLTHKRGSGGAAESLPHLGLMLGDYYSNRGWDEEGIPTREKLVELGLEEPPI